MNEPITHSEGQPQITTAQRALDYTTLLRAECSLQLIRAAIDEGKHEHTYFGFFVEGVMRDISQSDIATLERIRRTYL